MTYCKCLSSWRPLCCLGQDSRATNSCCNHSEYFSVLFWKHTGKILASVEPAQIVNGLAENSSIFTKKHQRLHNEWRYTLWQAYSLNIIEYLSTAHLEDICILACKLGVRTCQADVHCTAKTIEVRLCTQSFMINIENLESTGYLEGKSRIDSRMVDHAEVCMVFLSRGYQFVLGV